jgi:hypothetical protein
MPIAIINFLGGMKHYKKSNPIQMGFTEDFVLMIAKGYMPLSIVESPWLKQMVLHLCGQIQFPSRKQWKFMFMSTFLFYCRKPWKFMCFLPLVNVQL